jgi:hypothetical protein
VIEKYTGVIAAADVFTESTTFQVMQSIRLDLGHRCIPNGGTRAASRLGAHAPTTIAQPSRPNSESSSHPPARSCTRNDRPTRLAASGCDPPLHKRTLNKQKGPKIQPVASPLWFATREGGGMNTWLDPGLLGADRRDVR